MTEQVDVSKRTFLKVGSLGVVAPLAVIATAKGETLEHHLPPLESNVRSIIHLEVGDEDWEPTTEDLTQLTDLFAAADKDPLGSIIETRKGVRVSVIQLPLK